MYGNAILYAPELLLGTNTVSYVDPPCNIWSLAATLVELFAETDLWFPDHDGESDINSEDFNAISAIKEKMDGWVNQAYSRLSTTHGHITDCKLDSVVYAGVCVVIFNVDLSCLGRMIYARQFLGAKPPIQFRHR